jgi:hypothetical protein
MPSHTPAWEVADIFRMHGEAYRKAYNVPWEHIKVMDDIMACRTPRLGGFIEHCDTCGFTREVYHSCGNRHCPKCQTLTKVRWVQARLAELLPVKYFHTVFTLPHELNPLILSNKAVMLDMLFAAVSQTLLAFGRNNLGGRLGFLAILHTWSQILLDHYHIHCVVPGGVLWQDMDNQTRHEAISLPRESTLEGFSREIHRPARTCPAHGQAYISRTG